jgi:hypothetical protein
MDDEERAQPSVRTLRIVQPVAILFLSLFAGVVCPHLGQQSWESEKATGWQEAVLLNLHGPWTLPVGMGLAAAVFLVLCKIPPAAGVVFGLVVSLLLLVSAGLLTWVLLSVV